MKFAIFYIVSVPLIFLSSIYSMDQQPSCSNFRPKSNYSENQDDAVPDEICSQEITRNRPRSDFNQRAGYLGNTPLSRHHVIPLTTLRDFYNTVINILIEQRTDAREFRSTFTSILYHMMSHRLDLWSHTSIETEIASNHLRREDVDRLRLVNNEGLLFAIAMRDNEDIFSARYAGAAGVALRDYTTSKYKYCTGINYPGLCVIVTAYLWMPWNIVIGPQFRTDDPGNQLDTPLLELLDVNHALQITSLNRRLNDFINHAENRTIENLRLIRDAFLYLINNFINPHPFSPNDWQMTGTFRQGNTTVTTYRARNRTERQYPINMRRKRQFIYYPEPCSAWMTKNANVTRYLYDASVANRLFFPAFELEKTNRCAYGDGTDNKTVDEFRGYHNTELK